MRVLDPIADINPATTGKPKTSLDSLTGKRVGLLWGRHAASIKFWPVLEQVIEEMYEPAEIYRLYKDSTWNPAPMAQIEELASKIDYAIIGVGA